MRPLEILLLLANVLTFLVLVVPKLSVVRWTGYVALTALLIAALQVLLERYRWQMVPAYVLTGIFFLIWLLQNIATARAPVNRLVVAFAALLGVLGLVVAIVLPIIIPVFRFPPPSGPYGIGTVTYHWVDTSRQEVFTANPKDKRELMVQLWYPAEENPSAPRAPYMQDARALATWMAWLLHVRLPEFMSGQLTVTTNATPSAPVAQDEKSYPVLIFTEGLSGFRQQNTFQVEELISHGYIVAAMDQPYAAASVVFPDGRQVVGMPKEQMWPLIEQSLSPVKTAPKLNGQTLKDGIIPYFARDAVFTLDQLTAVNQSDPNGILTGRLDLGRAGLVGLSLGGTVGSEACLREPRLKACLLEEAPLPADVVKDALQQPTLLMISDVETMRLARWKRADIDQHQSTMRRVFESLPGDGYFVQTHGTFHLNFTDAPLLLGVPLRALGLIGPINIQRAHDIINAYTLAFFDRHLKGDSAAFAGLTERYPEVRFETHRTEATAMLPKTQK